MRLALGAAVATLALFAAAPASATIHPIVASAECSNASFDVANPPGQTPEENQNHSEQSSLRALQSTGVLTSSGLDLTQPASKYTTFDPATETGTSDHPGIQNCRGG